MPTCSSSNDRYANARAFRSRSPLSETIRTGDEQDGGEGAWRHDIGCALGPPMRRSNDEAAVNSPVLRGAAPPSTRRTSLSTWLGQHGTVESFKEPYNLAFMQRLGDLG